MQVTPAFVGVCSHSINICALQVRAKARASGSKLPARIFPSKASFSISTPMRPPYLLTEKENRTQQSSVICQAPRAPLSAAVLLCWWISPPPQHNLSGCAHTRCGQG